MPKKTIHSAVLAFDASLSLASHVQDLPFFQGQKKNIANLDTNRVEWKATFPGSKALSWTDKKKGYFIASGSGCSGIVIGIKVVVYSRHHLSSLKEAYYHGDHPANIQKYVRRRNPRDGPEILYSEFCQSLAEPIRGIWMFPCHLQGTDIEEDT